jgi:hypothetical protein
MSSQVVRLARRWEWLRAGWSLMDAGRDDLDLVGDSADAGEPAEESSRDLRD